MTHSVFREMLLLSPHCSLNLLDEPVPSPPLQLFLSHRAALSDPPCQTPPEGWERTGKAPQETDKTNTEGTHLISLSASPTLGCGINTGRYLFIASQHPSICFSVSRGHTLIGGWMPLIPANLGTLSSAKAGEERSWQDLIQIRWDFLAI